ncbi:hypothetical protein [Azospirillum sp. TSO22-1]|uniref:hypothetical protein n=1 Tax=Azospirillum sp. TSO22-1 TaxID=716789 RepID=UPI000D61E660|nr:hypothetical protein [Azospirillum sp. TSO22-1]PWC32147.1 hypothetical protein TSO221_31285 [Azospirillum sp. TSO22-1]
MMPSNSQKQRPDVADPTFSTLDNERTIDEAIRRAQAMVAQFVPTDVSLADELITDRHTEAGRE